MYVLNVDVSNDFDNFDNSNLTIDNSDKSNVRQMKCEYQLTIHNSVSIDTSDVGVSCGRIMWAVSTSKKFEIGGAYKN